MTRTIRFYSCVLTILLLSPGAAAEWTNVAPGIDYQRFVEDGVEIHVARADLTHEELRLVATRERDRGLRVSEFAKRNHALVAINAGYFDKEFRPIGFTVSPCGQWPGSRDTAWGAVVAASATGVRLLRESVTMDVAQPWMTSAVSGWPTLVRDCEARGADELPGSRSFTHSPHARSAIGLSADGMLVYFVVAEGGRKEAPGLTLPRLAAWMRESLSVCEALNLDGGGSSTLWVKDHIANKPSDGRERRVGDHLAIVRSVDLAECESPKASDPERTPSETGEKAGRPTRKE
jgi:exopolysaccharide biosynthesis protein